MEFSSSVAAIDIGGVFKRQYPFACRTWGRDGWKGAGDVVKDVDESLVRLDTNL